ncbi:hypothetical protein Tco_0831396 [Tanacetum coccineum]
MEMWSGYPSDYGMLRFFDCVAYSHVKQGKLELYRLDIESPKIVTSRNVVFNESVIYKDALKDYGVVDCMMVVKEIENGLLEEVEKFGWWFEQDIGGENEDDNDKKLVMVNEGGRMS